MLPELRSSGGLAGLQKDFQNYLLTPISARNIETAIVGNAQASAALRLGVYADGYRLRLEETLRNDFEALHGLLGDEQFRALSFSYIDAHPSQHFSLRYFGQHLSGFLRTTEPYWIQPLLAEMAEFEWALIDAFDAPDVTPVEIGELAQLPAEAWPLLSFEVHGSLQRLALRWNTQPIWTALKNDAIPDPPQQSVTAIPWLIWRHQLKTWFRELSAQEAWALDALREGQNFAALCEGLCEWVDEEAAPGTAAGYLHGWISNGLVTRVVSGEQLTD